MKTAKVLSALIVIFFISNGLAAQNSALPKYFYGNYSAKIGSKQIEPDGCRFKRQRILLRAGLGALFARRMDLANTNS